MYLYDLFSFPELVKKRKQQYWRSFITFVQKWTPLVVNWGVETRLHCVEWAQSVYIVWVRQQPNSSHHVPKSIWYPTSTITDCMAPDNAHVSQWPNMELLYSILCVLHKVGDSFFPWIEIQNGSNTCALSNNIVNVKVVVNILYPNTVQLYVLGDVFNVSQKHTVAMYLDNLSAEASWTEVCGKCKKRDKRFMRAWLTTAKNKLFNILI